MMKNKWLSIGLAAIFLCSFVGCGEQGQSSSGSSGDEVEVVLTESPYYLTKNNVSEYTIVYPEDVVLGTQTDFAVSELQNFIYEATGVQLEAVADTGLNYSATAKYLSIGETTVFETANISFNKKALGDSGYIVKSKGESVFMVGGSYGTLNAVYDFLMYQFHFEVYAADEIFIDDCTKKDVKIYEYDITEIPDFNANIAQYGEMANNREYTLRMRMQQFSDVFMPEAGAWHNFMAVVSPLKYNDPNNRCEIEEEHDCIDDCTDENKNIADYPNCEDNYHPEWYSNQQLNLSCETSDLMVDVVVEAWKEYIRNSKKKTEIVWTFTQMDTLTWSNAPSSVALKEKYGTNSAEYIIFMNKCAEKMNPWLEENYPEKEYGYLIFAYQETRPAPIKEVNGEYVPVDNDVIMKDNVRLFYTTSRGDFYHPMTDDENFAMRDLLEQWQAVINGQEVAFWMYGSYFDNYLIPLDLTNCLQKNYQWAKEENCTLMLYQMQSDQNVASDWSRLNMYLQSKLGQNVNVDVNKLTDDFFLHYFKDANEPMRKLHDEIVAWQSYIDETMDFSFVYQKGVQLMSRQYWPYRTLSQWLDYIEEAYKAIEHYKISDSELYQKLHDRINLESITLRYMMLNCYSTRLTNQSMYAKELLNDCLDLGVSNSSEGGSIANALSRFM